VPAPLAERVGAQAPAQLLRMLLRHAAEQTVPDPENPNAIQMTDWLEIVLDDAPVILIAGLNEGFVPSSIHGDTILPDRLRAALGLSHNDQRMAREVHALTSMIEERRRHGRVAIVAGRFDAAGEPLVPSRLLLRGSKSEDVVRRARQLFAERASQASSLHPTLAQVAPGPGLPRIVPGPRDVYPHASLSVTAFKNYLACPYRFWLDKVMGLRELHDKAVELDAARFGNMVHAVLERFGSDEEIRDCADPARIDRALGSFLDDYVRDAFGDNARRTVAIQATLARRRLSTFAPLQAARVVEGWRIVAVEHTIGREDKLAPLPMAGDPFYVHGRIDRVDRHEDGRLSILDYKTGAKLPDGDHRSGPRNDRHWVNLQLPLYRLLVPSLDLPHTSVTLGYALLPRDPKNAGFKDAAWDAGELAEAEALAVDVASRIRSGVFWPPSDPPPPFSEHFAPICQDTALNAHPVPPATDAGGPP
jgi:ATP-dependent helicase/nuclease subunit B